MKLTPREEDLLAQLLEGKSNKQIASALGISDGTVKVYFTRLARKLGGLNRIGIALWAERRRLAHRYE